VQERAHRLYWASWIVALATTGIVAGFMLSHALLLGRYFDWLLTSGRARLLAETYPLFARSAGQSGLQAFYAIAGLQVVSGLAFLVISALARRTAAAGAIVGITAVLWPLVHYASGFGALEAQVLRSSSEVPAAVASAFVRWNGPIHLFHATTLAVALGALVSAPLGARAPSVGTDPRCPREAPATTAFPRGPDVSA
jgi:hypothetical protein